MASNIDVAKKYLGLQEVRDRKSLLSLFKQYSVKGDLVIDPSTTPWCSAFANVIERIQGRKGTGKLNARSWLTYGTKVEGLKNAQPGDWLVFARGGSSWQGHITLYAGMESKDVIRCLGGNQADSVCYSFYPTTRLLGIRRP